MEKQTAIVITGGIGFIGSHIATWLFEDNKFDKIILLDKKNEIKKGIEVENKKGCRTHIGNSSYINIVGGCENCSLPNNVSFRR